MQNSKTKNRAVWVLLTAAALLGRQAQAQVISIPSTYVLPSSAADTSKPGFLWRMSQVASVGAFVQSSSARAEAQLAGQLGDNVADPSVAGIASGPGTAPNPASAPIDFIIPTVINVDRGGGSSGNFTPDDQMPGSPGTSNGTDNQAAEVLTWLDLPAGDITMGVNSDDGFRLTIGGGSPIDKISAVKVGEYEGGRGAADSIFTFHVDKAGLYAARLLWYNGGGDSRVEWFTVKADGTKVLVNDTANGGIKAYRAATGATFGFITSVSPVSNAVGVQPNTTISAQIQEGRSIDTNSVTLSIDGQNVPAQVTKNAGIVTVSYTPTTLFNSLTTHTAAVSFNDDGPKGGQWSFTIAYVASIPASAKVAADTSKPGFTFRVSHVATISNWRNPITGSTDVNANERTDRQLAGLLTDEGGGASANVADPNAKGVASAVATAPTPANAPITFEIPSVINLSETSGQSNGTFPNDDQMPGAPGTDGSRDNFAAEIITYLDLPAGLVTMGVSSDDGFRAQIGTDILSAMLLGEYNGGRGATESLFSFVVQEAGVYPFRLTYENGTGDANIEWYTIQGGKRVLVNDSANGGIKAYRALSGSVPGRVTYVTPLPGLRLLNQESSSLVILISDGSSPVDDKSVTLTVDGASVTPTAAREGNGVRVTYTPATLQIPGNVHSATLAFKDGSGATQTRTWQFRNLKNIVLPAASVVEDFNSTAEGSVPAGWTAQNFTDCSGSFCTTPGNDLDDLNSDTYKGWVVVDRERLNGLKGRIFQDVAPNQTVNGQPVTALGDGNVLYAESDVRDGNQVQFITSKAFDLSKLPHVVLTFDSLYEQNQDSIGSVEYSVDGGKTWLPVVYFIDSVDSGGDIKVKADGSVDALQTLNGPNPDTANWIDPVTKQAKGDNYGAFIAAPITDALSAYIVGRVNDDRIEGKRVEVFRLWQADAKSDVRLRFAQGGTGSWYFGVDNIAFYSAEASGTAPGGGTQPGTPTISVQRSATGLTVTYTGTLQSADLVGGPYTDVGNAANPFSTPATGAAKFYRAKQ